MMKNNFFKSFVVLFLMFTLCFGLLLPNALAATKYNYIANGEKDILGFKISGIEQIGDCDSIEIILTANKNIVEFSTYQDVTYNGVTYNSGNHTIEKTNNVAFIYKINSGETLSPIIIYLERIENTSCPLEIRFCNDDIIVEKINMTLVATFYADQASDLRENGESSSGSLTQEDVIISRPNVPKDPTDPVDPVDPEPPVEDCEHTTTKLVNVKEATTEEEGYTGDTVCENCGKTLATGKKIDKLQQSPVEECKHTTTKLVNAKEATTEEEGYTGDTVCETCGETLATGTKIDKLPEPSPGEVELPIIDGTSEPEPPTPDDPSISDGPDDPSTPPVTDPVTPPADDPTPPGEKHGIFDFINSIPKTYIYIAIGGVAILLIVVIILIIALGSKKKKKEVVMVDEVPTDIPPMPYIPDPEAFNDAEPQDDKFLINDDLFKDNTIEDIQDSTPAQPVETVDNNFVPAPIFNEPEPLPEATEIPLIDEFNELMLATLPDAEIEKVKYDFDEDSDGNGSEYDNLIS